MFVQNHEGRVKVNFKLEEAMKAQREKKVELYSFSNFGIRRGGWLTSWPGGFNLGKKNQYPVYRRLSEPAHSESQYRFVSSGTFVQKYGEYKFVVMFNWVVHKKAYGRGGGLDVTNNIFWTSATTRDKVSSLYAEKGPRIHWRGRRVRPKSKSIPWRRESPSLLLSSITAHISLQASP